MQSSGHTHRSQTAGVSNAEAAPGLQRKGARDPSRRLRRLGFTLAAVAGFASLLASPAAASSGKAPFSRRSHAAHQTHKQTQVPRSRHVNRTHARYVRTHPGTTSAASSHDKAAPLVNTVRDGSAMSPAVSGAILEAAGKSGIAPDLLMAIAWRESRFAPAARSRLSSATGLLQFTSGTWLQTVHRFGSQHGMAEYAAAIRKDASGGYTVEGRRLREAILTLRNDPTLSAGMAAEALNQQRTAMQASTGRSATATDLYLMHVLGPSGTARFLDALRQSPSAPVLKTVSRKVLRNAGLLARNGRHLTVLSTYEAIRLMLDDQHAHSEPAAATAAKSGQP